MKNSLPLRILIILSLYLGLSLFGGEIGHKILYPVHLLVTFLHELGHALGALFTGGTVLNLQVNADGSGFTKTAGGSRGIILMGGYIGSALMGNLLFYIGARGKKAAQITVYILAASMIISGILWFNSLYTTGFLLAFALALYFLSSNTGLDREILMFLGMASIFYIIQDFNVGPSSDLEAYAKEMVFIPQTVWMYIWLGIVVILTMFNVRQIWKLGSSPSQTL